MIIEMLRWEYWKRIWEKSRLLLVSHTNWKNGKGSFKQFSKRKTELYNELIKIIDEIDEFKGT